MKKTFYKKWWFWLVAIIVAFGVAGAVGGKENPKKVGEVTTSTKAEEKKKESKVFKIGDNVQLKDLKVTVNKVYSIKEDEFSKPKEGNEFIGIDCTVENTSNEEKTISSMMMFKVVDKSGRECEYSITGVTTANAGQLDGRVGSGRKITGVYAVEVPKKTTGLELEFNSSLIDSEQVIVKLN